MRKLVRFVLVLVLAATSFGFDHAVTIASQQDATPTSEDCPPTTTEENEALVARWYEEALNGRNVAVLDETLAPDLVHESGVFPEEPGPRFIIEALLSAFPDVIYAADYVASTDRVVVVRWIATGTHSGEFQDYPPTGRTATWTGINIFEVECGRISRVVTELDALGRMEQLGFEPAPVAATPTP